MMIMVFLISNSTSFYKRKEQKCTMLQIWNPVNQTYFYGQENNASNWKLTLFFPLIPNQLYLMAEHFPTG